MAATQFVRGDVYELTREGLTLSSDEMISRVLDWLARYPIVSVEDPLGEDDWPAWRRLTRAASTRCQLVGDDLFCTNPERIQRGISAGVANAVLIKLNQIGTVSDTLSALKLTQSAGYRPIVSARSGETEDPFIADLATATAAGQIKIGSLANSERLSKYNQLLRIQEEVGEASAGFIRALGPLAHRRSSVPARHVLAPRRPPLGRCTPALCSILHRFLVAA